MKVTFSIPDSRLLTPDFQYLAKVNSRFGDCYKQRWLLQFTSLPSRH